MFMQSQSIISSPHPSQMIRKTPNFDNVSTLSWPLQKTHTRRLAG